MVTCVLCKKNEATEPTGEPIDDAGPTCFTCKREIFLESQRERLERFSDESLTRMIVDFLSFESW